MNEEVEGILYMAWTIIANVSQGRWEEQNEEWQHAAAGWRQSYRTHLASINKD